MNKKLFSLFLLCMISTATFAADDDEITEGYYRIVNIGLELLGNKSGTKETTYCRVADSYIQISTAAGTSQDFQTLQLWSGFDDAAASPSTVIYVKKSDAASGWDLQAQGISVQQKLSGYNWNVSGSTSKCMLSATKAGQMLYLWTSMRKVGGHYYATTSSTVEGTAGTKKGDAYKQWKLIKINNDDNYVAVKPRFTVTKDGVTKYYAPYYASYPFRVLSSGMKVYYVSDLGTDYYTLKQITSDIIPAATPVLIECASETLSDNKIEPLYGVSTTPITDNKLSGCYFRNPYSNSQSTTKLTTFDKTKMRAWNMKDGQLVLSNNTTDYYLENAFLEDPGYGYYLFANESYATNLPAGTQDVLYNGVSKPKVTSISVDTKNISGVYYEPHTSKTVTVSVASASAAAGKTVTATSSNTAVATVNAESATVDANGNAQFAITSCGVGTATITYSTLDYNGNTITATTQVAVTEHPVESFYVDQTSLSASYTEPHKTWTVTVSATPAYVTKGSKVSVVSSNSAVAAVAEDTKTLDDNGTATFTIEGKSIGTADITFALDGTSYTAKTNVNITQPTIASATLDKSSVSVYCQKTESITITASPTYVSSGKTVTATSSDRTIASLKTNALSLDADGKATFTVNGNAVGDAVITFTIDGMATPVTATVHVLEQPIDAVTVDNATLQILYDNQKTVTVTATPALTASGKTVTATSSDNDVAAAVTNTMKLDAEGKATFIIDGKSAGNAVITFSVEGTSLKATTNVTVTNPPVSSVTLTVDNKNITLPKTNTSTVKVTATPKISAIGKTIRTSSNNNAVAIANEAVIGDDGTATITITAKDKGTAIITYSMDGTEATASTSVTVPQPDTLWVSEKAIEVPYLEDNAVTVYALPTSNFSGKKVTATSSDNAIAAPTSGTISFDESGKAVFTIEGKGIGTATVTFSVEGSPLTVSTQVTIPTPEITSFKVSDQTATIELYQSKNVTTTVLPTKQFAGRVMVHASSSDASVATVNESAEIKEDGTSSFTIETKSPGTATITYTVDNGVKTYTTTTIVTVPNPVVESFSVSDNNITIERNESKTVTVTLSPAKFFSGKMIYAVSSDPSVASVNLTKETSADGTATFTIVGIGKGSAIITYSYEDEGNHKYVSTNVTVILPANAPMASVPSGAIYKGTANTLSTTTSGCTIYYTEDGSDPRASNTRKIYSSPFIMTKDVTIKAVAMNAKQNLSDVAQYTYTLARNDEGVALQCGWNWVTFNMVSDVLKTYDGILALGTWGEGDEVKDRISFYDYSVKLNKWYGTMQDATTGRINAMNKIHSTYSQTLGITGLALNPDSCAVTLHKGWNYLPYIPANDLDINTAMADYEGVYPGDLIKSQDKAATYNGLEWQGTLTTLEHGKGYMMMRTEDGYSTFHYPIVYPIQTLAAAKNAVAMTDDGVKTHLFSSNMNIIANVEGDNVEEGDVIVATANGEVRGTVTVDASKKVIMTIEGDEATDVTLSLQRDGETVATAKGTVTYQTDAIIGSWDNPTAVTFVDADSTEASDNCETGDVYGIDGKSYGTTKTNTLSNGAYIIKNGSKTTKMIKK